MCYCSKQGGGTDTEMSWHRKMTLENKTFPSRSCQDLNPNPLDHKSIALPLSYPHSLECDTTTHTDHSDEGGDGQKHGPRFVERLDLRTDLGSKDGGKVTVTTQQPKLTILTREGMDRSVAPVLLSALICWLILVAVVLMLASAQLAAWLDQSEPGASLQLIAFKICINMLAYVGIGGPVYVRDQVVLTVCLDTKCLFLH